MPELPEVETIKRQLAVALRNKKINRLEIRLPKLIKGSVFDFKKKVIGSKIENVGRRAKLLLLNLSNGYSVIIHLKMTGQLIFKKPGQEKIGGHPIKNGSRDLPNKYTQAIFSLSGKSKLFFNDIRKFGYFRLVKTKDLASIFEKNKFGPEPFDVDLRIFENILSARKKSKIKQVLLDQTVIAGLGNIYATEACFYAGIKPTRIVGRLSRSEKEKLLGVIQSILRNAIKKQGTSSNTYVDAYGGPGSYFPLLKVYGRKGESCFKCKSKIKAIVMGGRGTTYCPNCQK